MKKRIILLLFCFVFFYSVYGQIERVEPPNWWVGMKNQKLELLVYGKNMTDFTPSVSYPGVSLKRMYAGENPNYLFLDLQISKDAKPGVLEINFSGEQGQISYPYALKERVKKSNNYVGFDSSDVIYLITPDRFANGNPKNDVDSALLETELDREHDYKRHGGDIKGIIDNLDYIADMGFTAIWSSPLLENNMSKQSYHGYAITDFYGVDPRFGSLEEYIELSQKASKKELKLVMDQVANHCGREHWWMKDLPFDDWVNFQEEYEKQEPVITTNHRRTANQDPYASKEDKQLMEKGWFVSAMPDLNQENPFMATYLIQNSIWWIETLQLGGIRQDTYPYPDKEFMAKWAGAIMTEYPNFNIVGEEWSYNPLLVGYWQEGAKNKDGYNSNLPSSMDFPMQKALVDALTEPETWDTGLVKLYESLGNDFYYPNPKSILFFGDNHDMSRIHTQLNLDLDLTKMAMAYILSAPRIPQVYYGTEILMEDSKKPGDHGLIRSDFPGGWKGDRVNAFSGKGLSKEQLEMQSYLKKLMNYRKGATVIHDGKTKHFAPENGVYVLFRYNEEETLMLVLNKNTIPTELSLDRFSEMNLHGKTAKNIISDVSIAVEDKLKLPPKTTLLLSIN